MLVDIKLRSNFNNGSRVKIPLGRPDSFFTSLLLNFAKNFLKGDFLRDKVWWRFEKAIILFNGILYQNYFPVNF